MKQLSVFFDRIMNAIRLAKCLTLSGFKFIDTFSLKFENFYIFLKERGLEINFSVFS